ncbi:DNRLRE domain-containing protein [Streptomyces violascens]|uniref:DNRLRE domain-containing protein n=1 Tax=Streptomyces violascens TaxID=67381 RepID=UPI003656A82E
MVVAEAALLSAAGTAASAPKDPNIPATGRTSPVAVSEQDVLRSDLDWAAGHAKGSLAWALGEAKKTGKKVVADDETTATTYTVANPDGTLTTELTSGPERVWRDGKWSPVDATLTTAPDGTVTARNHPGGLRLAGAGGTAPNSLRAAASAPVRDLVTLGRGDKQVTLQWKGGLPAPQVEGTRARYRDALPDADVIVDATRTGFEQFVEVRKRPADGYTYTLPIRTQGLETRAGKDGSITFYDPEAKAAAAEMPAPVMWDASVDPVSGLHTNRAPVDVQVVNKGDGDVDLVMTPDAKWLSAPGTRFPVTVDPATRGLSNLGDTYVQRGETKSFWSDAELDFGNPGTKNADGTFRTARSYISWNTEPFKDALVQDAKLSLWNFHSGNTDCTPKGWKIWNTGTPAGVINWANQDSEGKWYQEFAYSPETKGNAACTGQADGWINADVTKLAQTWASAKQDASTLGLRGMSEDNTQDWKRVNSANATSNQPKLTVTYNYRPQTGDKQQAGPPFKSYAGVWAVNTTGPTLRDTFDDRDGDKVSGSFQVYDAATNQPVKAPNADGVFVSEFAPQGTPVDVKIPDGTLQDGRTYKFRTNAYDGTHYNTDWSPWRQFVVDTTAPGEPARISSTTYPEGEWGGGKGKDGRFDVTTGDAGAREIRFRFNGLDDEADEDPGVLRAPAAAPATWQTAPTTNGSGAFNTTPAEDGANYVEVQTVDRADNVGATREYGFLSGTGAPVRTNHVIDITLPEPKKDDGHWMAVGEWQQIQGGTPPARAGLAAPKEQCTDAGDGKMKCFSSTPATGKPAKHAAPRGAAQAPVTGTPAPIVASCADQNYGNFTRTEMCLGYNYVYWVYDKKTKVTLGKARFNIDVQVKTDPKSTDIKFWARVSPTPLMPAEPPLTGELKLIMNPTCDFGCTSAPQFKWDGPMAWKGAQPTDPHEQTGTATMSWDQTRIKADATKDKDRSEELPIRFYLQANSTAGPGTETETLNGNVSILARCDAVKLYEPVAKPLSPGCVFPQYKPGWVIDPAEYPAAAAHAWLIANKMPGNPGLDSKHPLHYLPMSAKGKAQRNMWDRTDRQNRAAICGRSGKYGFVKHPKTVLYPDLRAKDVASCDEYAFNATYESAGMPSNMDGTNPVGDGKGAECVQTYEGLGTDGRKHLRDDGRYAEPDWNNVKCGRSSMSLAINSGAMAKFGDFASSYRLLDKDGYYVSTGLEASGCDPSKPVITCTIGTGGNAASPAQRK